MTLVCGVKISGYVITRTGVDVMVCLYKALCVAGEQRCPVLEEQVECHTEPTISDVNKVLYAQANEWAKMSTPAMYPSSRTKWVFQQR